MEFALTDEHRLITGNARKLGDKFGLAYWSEIDRKQEFPAACWKAICASGFAGIALPAEHGGGGLGILEMVFVIESLCACGAGSTLSQVFMLNPVFGGVSIARYGSDKMKAEILPAIVSGEINCCMALTEPNAGTNTLNMESFATRSADGWVLNGRKTWITGVPYASKMLVVARTERLRDNARRSDGISLFLIDVDRGGVAHQTIDKVGTNTLPASNVYFDNVRISADELLGEEHKGWPALLDILNVERMVTTAGLVGTAELAIRLAVKYANERRVFAKPISSHQGLQFPLAQHHAELECARLLNYKAAWQFDNDLSSGSAANIAKLIAAQSASGATDRAMQTMGGMGYSKEYHVERLWRDARLFRIAPVSEEMIYNYIANHELGMVRGY